VSRDLHDRLAARLFEVSDGPGFGPSPGAPAEPEPTALAAIALDDDDARGWLIEHQGEDGGFGVVAGPVRNDAPTSLAAIALPPGQARERAIDHLVGHRAQAAPWNAVVPHDGETRGWGWTPDTFGWIEPTARAVLALRLLRPGARAEIADGLAVIADRECRDGGWNYGNPVVYGTSLEPYAQTTAMALIGIQGALPEQTARGLRALGDLWRREPGGLSLAVALAALRLAGRPESAEVEKRLGRLFDATGLLDDVVALAWGALATGDGLEVLRWRAA
jgi:hypothetical protein